MFLSESGEALRTILELAHEEGRATGIVTDGALTNPTAAAFYAHANNAKQPQEFANALIERDAVDIALGGGATEFKKEKLDQTRIRSSTICLSWNKSRNGNSHAFSDSLRPMICRLPTKSQRGPSTFPGRYGATGH